MAKQTLTPRQKMINMMYLVLIAMLALNVSREILKSFHLFELSYINANESLQKKNAEMMLGFEAKMANEKTKPRTEEWYKLAVEAKKTSDEFCAYIEEVKKEIIKQGGGREENEKGKSEISELKRPDDMETHANYFLNKNGNGVKLQNKINETRSKLASLVKTTRNGKNLSSRLDASSQLKAIDPPSDGLEKKTWVSVYLENAPLAGVVTLLTKVQTDCRNLESDVLNILNDNINISTLSNNMQMAMIIPESQTVMSGEFFKAKVALATYDTKVSSNMLINGKAIEVKDGFGYINIPAQGTGTHKLVAEIESIDPNTGQAVMVQSTPLEWSSFQASAAISADNMNVLFFGLENPISISVPGITPENTIVSSNNGIALKSLGKGKYAATVSGNSKEGTIFVKARMADGSIKSMGEMKYKLRKVPKPKLRFGTLEQGSHERSEILAQQFFFAYLEDFYFKGVTYTVTKFRITIVKRKHPSLPEKTIIGNRTADANSILKSASSGDLIYIDQIKVKGPNGELSMEDFSMKVK